MLYQPLSDDDLDLELKKMEEMDDLSENENSDFFEDEDIPNYDLKQKSINSEEVPSSLNLTSEHIISPKN